MVQQGFGHNVNTASLAGLSPSPMELSYVTSKYGVVGLSTALRGEAKDLGVRVSVVCPGLIDTPIAQAMGVRGMDREQLVTLFRSAKPTTPDACARVILRGVEKNKAIIVVTGLAHVIWYLTRLSPNLALRFWGRMFLRPFRALRQGDANKGVSNAG